ncbi:unnamed protein product [Symbiodinium natans]|uniref:Uncharacterized protein n=1 Tax=Symbiodinium natans TaxID=878477 RepID=A0A812UF69_9DINO|nr:unnamed protein product [Symbiodinium natans]
MPLAIRVKLMKVVLMPTITSFGRSRQWNQEHLHRLQRVVHRAIHRCFNVRPQWLQQHHVKRRDMAAFVGWEPVEATLGRQCLNWLGHVARMKKEELPKLALCGWWSGYKIKQRPKFRQQQWIQYLLAQIKTSELDWFRLAQDREAWRREVAETYPAPEMTPAKKSKGQPMEAP